MDFHFQYGDIFLVDFDPSVGHEYKKERPAVIIQSDNQLRKSNLITVMPLTSKAGNRHADDILVTKGHKNRLLWDSLIKVHAIVSFDKSRFIKKIGELDDEIMMKIKQYIRRHFDV